MEGADGFDATRRAPSVRIGPAELRLSRSRACSPLLLRGIEGIRACPAMASKAVAIRRPRGIDQAIPILLLDGLTAAMPSWTPFHRAWFGIYPLAMKVKGVVHILR